MLLKDLPPAETLDDVLRQVADCTIYECGLSPIYEQALADGWIEWTYFGLDDIGWLRLTDKALAHMGMAPNRPTLEERFRAWLGANAKSLKSRLDFSGKDRLPRP